MVDSFLLTTWVRIRVKQFDRKIGLKYMSEKRKYYKLRGLPKNCDLCGCKLDGSNRTVDHIIPRWFCLQYNMPHLVFMMCNFRVVCYECNFGLSRRQTTLDTLEITDKQYDMLIEAAKWTCPPYFHKLYGEWFPLMPDFGSISNTVSFPLKSLESGV